MNILQTHDAMDSAAMNTAENGTKKTKRMMELNKALLNKDYC